MAETGHARAIYDYEARASDELSFRRHNIILVLGKDEEDEGWYRGTLDGRTGLFPNNYVQFVEAPAPAPTAPAPTAPAPASAPAATPPVAAPPAATPPAAKAAPKVPEFVVCADSIGSLYTMAETLGRGRFSQVRRCTQVGGERSCAVKIMDLADPELGNTPAEAEREVLAEAEVLRQLQHGGIVQLLEVVRSCEKYYLVTEDLGGGDLFDRIEQNGPYKEDDAAPLVRQVVSAVSYLHERSIAHRDLKPDNLVFETRLPDARIKLIDFGYAGVTSASRPLKGLCGTPDYAAPEILTWYAADKSKRPQGTAYTQSVDLWSLGVVLYILLCGFPPFYGDDDEQMFSLIASGTYSFPDAIDGYQTTWSAVSDSAKALIRSLLTVSPAQRATAQSVLSGEWLAARGGTARGAGWVGKMRERSNSGWRAGAKPSSGGPSTSEPRLDRGQIDRGAPSAPPEKVNTDAKMVFGGGADGGHEGKLKYTLEQKGLVSQFSRWIVDRMFIKREMRILMLGLDNSGKTSILYRLKLGQPKRTIPTIGFNVETLEYKNIAFTVWDVGGQEKLRALWRHYFANTQALIFVVDSSDRGRLRESAEELHRLIKEEELHNSLLLVFANKQDLPGACNAAEISEEMRLYPPYLSKSCYIQSCCATTGDGLYEGLDWLSSNLPEPEDEGSR